MYAPKEESLVPIENIRAARIKVRNLPNIEIANWIVVQRHLNKRFNRGGVLTLLCTQERKLNYKY